MNAAGAHVAPRNDTFHDEFPDPAAQRLRWVNRRKALWVVLLTVGYWFATPYYFPWTAAEEASADSRAIAAQGSIQRQLALPCLALLALYMLWRTSPLPKMRGYLYNAAVLFLLANLVSIAWSVDPSVSVRRYVVFLMDVLLIVTIARVFPAEQLARLGFFVTAFAASCALFIDVAVTRSFAPLDPNYRLMGIMSSNYMGENLTVCIFSGLTLLWLDNNRRKWLMPALLGALTLLYLTRSRTATISCLLFSSFIIKRVLNANVRREARILLAMAVIGFGSAAILTQGNPADIVQKGFMMGRNDTQNTSNLSNRLPLWQELFEFVGRRPWLGYGYRAFWTPDRIAVISAHQGWPVPNAHNTYLDEYISTGIVGAPLFAFVFWGGLFVAWRRYVRNPTAERLYPAVMLSWIFFTSWFEAIPPDPFLPTTLAYVCLVKSFLPEEGPTKAPPGPIHFGPPPRTQPRRSLAAASSFGNRG